MRTLLTKLALGASLCLATALAQAGAYVAVDFDNGLDTTYAPFAPLMGHGDALVQGQFYVETYSTKSGAQFGDLTGLLVNGADVANTCFGVMCPTNNSTNFLAMLDDGLPVVGRMDGQRFNLAGFDAGFIAGDGAVIPGLSMILRVIGFIDGQVAGLEDFYLPGLEDGVLNFNTFNASAAFASTAFDYFGFYGYACNNAGSCSRSGNTAQFGIDNISVVPVPPTLALVAVALGAMGGLRRRRSTQA